jgi:hypothetical protein
MLLLAGGLAVAQSREPLRFRTPFAFIVGDQLMPAGEYTVRVETVAGVLSFRGSDGKAGTFIRSMPLVKSKTATRYRLVFHNYGAHYYISEIWVPGYETGRVVVQHPSELEVAKNAKPRHIVVVLEGI